MINYHEDFVDDGTEFVKIGDEDEDRGFVLKVFDFCAYSISS